MSTIVWFRQDLRLKDNPALLSASQEGVVIPVYIWDRDVEGTWALGEASRWWLKKSLFSLKGDLERMGSSLVIRKGETLRTLFELIEEVNAKKVYWSRRYEPYPCACDAKIRAALEKKGITTQSFNASLLAEPGEIKTKAGTPFQVFTPFWSTLRKAEPFIPLTAPTSLISPRRFPASDTLENGSLTFSQWEPGEKAACEKLEEFVERKLLNYEGARDRADLEGVSRLSPHLHFGEISPRQIWALVLNKRGGECFLRQIAWREFAYHLLFHFPHTPEFPLREEFSAFPWNEQDNVLTMWKQGRTGYPLIDAGMRQLLVTGWMHNRLRLLVGSFLTKDLRIPWQKGARWFWETLVDADLANNTLGWQWVAGCGADAAPYFRIFNPVTQGKKIDPEGVYVKRWIPELRLLAPRWIHAPWEASENELRKSEIVIGDTYPHPLVDHQEARKYALKAFERVKERKKKR